MNDFDRICDFQSLYRAHRAARLGKRVCRSVILFEMNLSERLTALSRALKDKTYRMSGYYFFKVHDPKEREIHALRYTDRVVQHALCDEVLGPLLERKLIFDNAACRVGKGTHFALNRVSGFFRDYYKKHGAEGWILKCDIRKFFDNIDHEILKEKLEKVVKDKDVMWLLDMFIDSYEKAPGKGLPLGNQSSQWFAVYYLDSFDRLIKEKLKIKYYSRYMDDSILICEDKNRLKSSLSEMKRFVEEELKLEFNAKTQISPIKNGVDYLGFHFYMTKSGKVIRKVRLQTKIKYKRKLRYMVYALKNSRIQMPEVIQVLASCQAHLQHGNTYKFQRNLLENEKFALIPFKMSR